MPILQAVSPYWRSLLIRELEDIRDSQDPLEDLAMTMDAIHALERHGNAQAALEVARSQRAITKNALRVLEAREREAGGQDV